MAIRVRLTDPKASVRFALSPLLETLSSLHVLREPEHHPLNHSWVRAMRDLPAPLRRDLVRFAFVTRAALSAVGVPIAGVERGVFEDELARLRNAAPDEAVRFLTRAHYRDREPLSSTGGVASDAAAEMAAYSRRSRAGQELAERTISDPAGVLREFADVVESYWRAAFAERWDHYRPLLEQSIAEAKEQLPAGLDAVLGRLWPELRMDAAGNGFDVERTHEHEIALGADARLVLIPSFFVWPHVRVFCEMPGTVVLAFAPAQMLQRVAPVAPPGELLGVLGALADDTRLRLLRYLYGHPRSTQELAALVGVSAPTLSEHLHKLESAGVLRSRREGPYVLYEFAVDIGEVIREKVGRYLSRT